MLNLLRSTKLEFRQFCIETAMALGMGVLLAAVMITLQESEAQKQIASHLFDEPRNGANLEQDLFSDHAAAHDQAELGRLKARVQYLSRRQEERDDLIDVQAILLAQAWGRNGGLGELSSLQWQHGKLEFEGVTLAPEDWHMLLTDLNLFGRWKKGPQVFHAHRALIKPIPGGGPQIEVKLKANLWAHASNSLPAQSAP